MKIRKFAAAGALVGAGVLALGANPAGAGGGPVAGPQHAASSANGDGVVAGNSVAVPIAVPIEVACNANGIGVVGLGVGFSACDVEAFSHGGTRGAGPVAGPQHAASSAEGDGVVAGNSVAAPVAVPVEVASNANGIGVLGLGVGFSASDLSVFSG
jgi:hypothetical protein